MRILPRMSLAWLVVAAVITLAGIPGIAGADNVVVTTSTKNGKTKLTIQGDTDGNSITITQSNGMITVTGNGGTTINFGGTNTFPVPDELKITMGDGADSVELDGVTVDRVRIQDGDADNETVTIKGSTIDRLEVHTGAGDDTVTSENSTIRNKSIDTDGGNDTVTGFDNRSDRLSLRLGGGNDVLVLVRQKAKRARIDLGAGDDQVWLDTVKFGRSHLWGHSGEDCLDRTGGALGHPSVVHGFEAEFCGVEPPPPGESGRAVVLDYDTGDLSAGDRLCLSEIAAGGCTATGPECQGPGGPLLHLHGTIAISGAPDVLFSDPNGGGCGHGEVIQGVPGCGADTVPGCGG